MRISKAIAGVSIAALVTAPIVLAQADNSLFNWRSSRAISKLTEDGANAVSSALSMAALADDTPASPIDFDKLVKFEGKDYTIEHDGTMSTEVLANFSVKKLGYGKVTEVKVFRTPTGTFSTDGLFSPKILYPGIKVTPAAEPIASIFSWIPGFGWAQLNGLASANSTVYFGGSGNSSFVATDSGTCYRGPNFITCT
jgi:hypothetical protein